MNVRFAMLVSPNKERVENARAIKKIIPQLELYPVDATKQDLFSAHIAVMQTDPNKYDGVVMMEDDIILCKDFMNRLMDVLNRHKGDVVQFFERALCKNLTNGWFNGRQFFSCCCYYMPAKHTSLFASKENKYKFTYEVFPKRNEPWGYPIDLYIAYVLGENKIKYWRELPYLVQHRNLKSTFKGRSTKRQSIYFIDDIIKEP